MFPARRNRENVAAAAEAEEPEEIDYVVVAPMLEEVVVAVKRVYSFDSRIPRCLDTNSQKGFDFFIFGGCCAVAREAVVAYYCGLNNPCVVSVECCLFIE